MPLPTLPSGQDGKAPALVDTSVLVNAQKGMPGASLEVHTWRLLVTDAVHREFVNPSGPHAMENELFLASLDTTPYDNPAARESEIFGNVYDRMRKAGQEETDSELAAYSSASFLTVLFADAAAYNVAIRLPLEMRPIAKLVVG